MKLLYMLLGCLLVAFPFVMVSHSSGSLVLADDEIIDEVDDTEATVEEESAGDEDSSTGAAASATDTEEEEDVSLKPSPDAETTLHFVRPTVSTELPAGKPVRLLVGFLNKGDKEFTVDAMDAAFHYPQDYSYYIQNFTTLQFSHLVESGREATFDYGFTPSEVFGNRPFVLTVNLYYHDADGANFVDAIFNSTITIVEPDEGLDGETFFLYVFLAAVVALGIFGAYHFLFSFGKKRMSSKPRAVIETGTQSNKNDVDYDWLPKEHLEAINKSPGRSPKSKTSPRLRSAAAAKRRSGAVDD